MKKICIITISIVMGLVSLSNASAADKVKFMDKSKIEQMISFYQERLYLLDSEYSILSDIAKDASKMITYLQTRKDRLVQEMKDNKIDFSPAKMNSYLLNRARIGDMS